MDEVKYIRLVELVEELRFGFDYISEFTYCAFTPSFSHFLA